MSETVSFEWVELEGFRGFKDRQRIELDASAVVVSGPNGTGKTSFFDAIQWLLLGSLQRLEQWRVRKNDEHIVNRYMGSKPAVVEAGLKVGDSLVRLRRQGSYDSSFFEWSGLDGTAHGLEAERRLQEVLATRPGQDVRRLLLTSALLQQDVVREVLEDKPTERYQQLSVLLGLDDLSDFDTSVRKRAERMSASGKKARLNLEAAEERAGELRSRVETMERDMQLAEDVRQARERIAEQIRALAPTIRVDPLPVTSADAALLQQAAQSVGSQLGGLIRTADELGARRTAIAAPADEEIRRLEQQVADAQQRVQETLVAAEAAETRLADVKARGSQLSALAAQALDLLGQQCPVCGQDISPDCARSGSGPGVRGR